MLFTRTVFGEWKIRSTFSYNCDCEKEDILYISTSLLILVIYPLLLILFIYLYPYWVTSNCVSYMTSCKVLSQFRLWLRWYLKTLSPNLVWYARRKLAAPIDLDSDSENNALFRIVKSPSQCVLSMSGDNKMCHFQPLDVISKLSLNLKFSSSQKM